MITISERLRARQEPVGDGSGKWRKDGLCQEAAEIMDECMALLEQGTRERNVDWYARVDAALAKAKGKQG